MTSVRIRLQGCYFIFTAKAFAYSESSCCEGGLQALKNSKYLDDSYMDKRTPAGMDYVKRRVLVEPEGLPREYTYSIFFCPNEKIHISTPNKYEYQYIQKPARMVHFDVAVKAHNDAHFALSTGPHDTAEMVEIVIGGRQNTRTWIAVSKMGEPVVSANTSHILSWDEFRNFWVCWKTGIIQVGHGVVPEISYIGFSTGWGSMGEFKIWRKEESDENHNEAFTLGVPHNVVPGSERATASMIGDVMGPTLNNLDNLLRLPFGCGEQNMIHFAPNVFVLKYLQKTKQLFTELESEATDYLLQGYQRQLTYKRDDGSYSAFGERDSSGSMWLTAFVLKSFAQSRGFIFIDPKELITAKDWIIQHQKEDGSFPAVGRILNKDIQGGIHGRISLTAYVVAALLETGITSEEEKAAVGKAKHFLEMNTYSADDPYTTALSAYALTLLRSKHAPIALRKLNNMAIMQDAARPPEFFQHCFYFRFPASAVFCFYIMLERIIGNAIYDCLDRDTQHGFKEKGPCLTNLIIFFEEFPNMMDEGSPAEIVCLDIQKLLTRRCTTGISIGLRPPVQM
ncbi:C3 and PZP-like alpha-2-macroglobulin domain-containing protein 8, partial [Heterodontus francisci]|uniref:C3 and PZP-like alpha-2-macroglobulin domain-containing protein 8 n=1 Tax=Heterodontus francisci TaxID=7792 RepID=UPI00355B1127